MRKCGMQGGSCVLEQEDEFLWKSERSDYQWVCIKLEGAKLDCGGVDICNCKLCMLEQWIRDDVQMMCPALNHY